jgi:hypothetical protein
MGCKQAGDCFCPGRREGIKMRTLNVGKTLRTSLVGGLAALAIAGCGNASRDSIKDERAFVRAVQEHLDGLQLRVDNIRSAYQEANMNSVEMLRLRADEDVAILYEGYETVRFPYSALPRGTGNVSNAYGDPFFALLVVSCSSASHNSTVESLYYDGADPKMVDIFNMLICSTIGDTLKFDDAGYISGVGHSGERVLKGHAERL